MTFYAAANNDQAFYAGGVLNETKSGATSTFAGPVLINASAVRETLSELSVQGGMSEFETTLTSGYDWANSPISILERGNIASGSADDKYAPNLNFHWSSRVSNSLWMGDNGQLNWGSYTSAGVPTKDGTFNAANGVFSNKVDCGADLNFGTNGFADISNVGTGAIRFKPSSETLALTLTGANATFAGKVGIGVGSVTPAQPLHVIDTDGANIILNSNTGAENNGIWMTEGAAASPYTNGAYLHYDSTANALKINTGTTTLSTRFTLDRDTGNATFAGITSITGGGSSSPSGVEGLHLMYDTNHAYIKSENNGTTNRPLTFVSSAYTFNVGNATFAGSIHLDNDSSQLQLGDDNDMQIYHNGAQGEINVATGNFTIDSVGDITLDAEGTNDIIFKYKGSDTAMAIDGGVMRIITSAPLQADGGIVLNGDSNIQLDTAVSSGESSGTIIKFGGHVSDLTAGIVYFLYGASLWSAADADNHTNGGCTQMLALSLGTDADVDGMLLDGIFYDSGHGFTVGAPLYCSDSTSPPGQMTDTAPTGSGDIVRIVGYAIDADHIYFSPDKTWIELD